MIDKLYDINKQLDSLKDISYYCELREGVIVMGVHFMNHVN